ncbi:MAG: chromosome segregation protein SMC [Coriobacteriales bacterium]|jgi:chromosome segregation protein
MYLKSIILKGFKSFADRSVINFEPGISAIVGPNGSGKSNISEAVLWVLGERKVTNLRVHAMEELIFSGSSARPAAKVAEVDLVLDNSDGVIPIEFSEVVITRRMHHNGDSEYLINGSPCLRRDIIDILHDCGIGEGVHSVITQGNLTAMIESRPVDRLLLLEEAAGVLKHKTRKERAARQLARMDATLNRVRDIQKVIESQLRPLERQAARAQRYEEYSTELRQLNLSLAVDDLRALQGTWEAASAREKEADAAVELARIALEEREAEVARRQAALEEKGLFVGDLNEQRTRCQEVVARLDANIRLVDEKGKNMVARLIELETGVETARARLASARDELAQARGESAEVDARLQGLYTQFNELNKSSEQITKERREAQDAYNSLAMKLRSSEHTLTSVQHEMSKIASSLESLDVEEGLLRERMEQTAAELDSEHAQLADNRKRGDGLSTDILKAQGELTLARSDIDKRVRLLDQARNAMKAKRDQLAEIQAEIRALREIDRAFDTATPSMNWITEHQQEFSGIAGRLSQVIHAPVEFEPLVERLLGADISALLVADMKSANLIADRLLASGEASGEVSFLPLSSMRATARPGEGRGSRLVDLLEIEDSYADAVEALLGDVHIADSIAQAVEFHEQGPAGVRYATRDGAVVWPSGKITLGSQIADMEGVLARQRKLNSLLSEQETCSANLGEAEMAVSEAERALELAQQDGFELSEQLAKLQGAYDSCIERIKQLEQHILQLARVREQTEEKLADVAVRRDKSQPLAAEHRARVDKLTADIESVREETERSSKLLFDITQEKTEITERLSNVKAEMEACRAGVDFRLRRIERLETEIAELERSIATSDAARRSLALTRKRVEPLRETFEALAEGAAGWQARIAEQTRLMQSDSSSLRSVIETAKRARDEASAALTQANDALNGVRIEKARLEADVTNAVRRIEEDNKTSIEAAMEVEPPEDRAQAEDAANRLRRKIENLGAVNHVAMEEYENLKNRRDYIEAQVADLVEARKTLTHISRSLDARMKRQFTETFESVNKSFQALYSQLSPGDAAELVVIDKTGEEEGGVELFVHPRGMKLTSLSLLSGGQSALVAIAFLFAIYMTRNAPFYILDEIEPSLDGTNLQRVCDLLEAMRERTQIIMVTHQRQTMEIADILYGVSKQASGVSKVVSQKLDVALRNLEQEERGQEAGE